MSGILSAIKATFTADTAPLKRGVDDSKKALKSVKSEGGKAINDLSNMIGVDMGKMSAQFSSFSKISTQLFTGFKSAASGTSALSAALKVLKMALISTGIGAIVVALGSLVAYLTQTQAGADKLSQAMSAFGAVLNVLVERFVAFGKGAASIIEGIFTGSWAKVKEGANSMADAFKGAMAEIKNEASAAYDLKRKLNELEQKEIDLSVSLAERRAKIAELITASKEEGRSTQESIKMQTKARELLKTVGEDEMGILKERAQLMEAMGSLSDPMRKDEKEIADAKIAVLEKERSLHNEIRSINADILTFKKQQAAADQAAFNELKKMYADKDKLMTALTPKGKEPVVVDSFKLAAMPLNELTEQEKEFEAHTQRVAEIAVGLEQSLATSMNAAAVSLAGGFADMIGQMATGNAGMEDFGNMILSTMGGIIQQLGTLILTAGIGMTKFAAMLSNPFTAAPAAIAAGALLIAVGSAIKGLASSGSSGSGSSVATAGGSGTIDTRRTGDGQQKVYGEFRIKGADLVAVVGKETTRKNTVS